MKTCVVWWIGAKAKAHRHAWALRLRILGFKGSISTANLPEGKLPTS